MDIPTYRGRGPNVPDNVNNIIAEVYIKDRNQTAKEVMREVQRRLRKPPYEQLRPDWPGLSYIQKEVTKFRKKESELPLDPEDRPWSVAALADYDIPPEALPAVMKAWVKALEQDEPLTIRQVKWISRLYCLLGDMVFFSEIARDYASREKAIKLTGAYPDKPQNMHWLWFNDAILYLLMEQDDRALALPKFLKKEVWRSFIGPESITAEELDPFGEYLLSKIRNITVDEDSNQPEGQNNMEVQNERSHNQEE